MRILSLQIKNFLSYRAATLKLGDLTVLVGPNASGKSNCVSALKLLREIPIYGLPAAVAGRGGFEPLRHRNGGRQHDPSFRIEFQAGPEDEVSAYALDLGALKGKGFQVEDEELILNHRGKFFYLIRRRSEAHAGLIEGDTSREEILENLPEGASALPRIQVSQSALPAILHDMGALAWDLLRSIQTVEIDPARLRNLQDSAATDDFTPDGSNAASVFEALGVSRRRELADQLAAVVPGIVRIEPRHLAHKTTLTFTQQSQGRSHEFFAAQMSDGTLRAFGILLALMQPNRPSLVVIEEPETAIHLGALQTLVEILRSHAEDMQILLTTHSADIVDHLNLDELRVVWSDEGVSRIAPVAEHTRGPVKEGLVTPGELLRFDALDPAVA